MQDAWRAYLELALGLTEASKKRAQAVARKLVGSSGATAAQLQGLAEELVSTGLANREALTRIVRAEIDRTLGRLGLASADEVTELAERVRGLERELAALRRTAAESGVRPAAEPSDIARGAGVPAVPAGKEVAAPATTGGPDAAEPGDGPTETAPSGRTAGTAGPRKAGATGTAVKKAVAKKAAKKVAKKTVAKKAVVKKAAVKKAGAAEPSVRQAGAKKTTAKKTVAKKVVAKKAAPRTAPAAKRTPPGEGGAA